MSQKIIQKKLNRKVGKGIIAYEKNGAIVLEGFVESWEKVIEAGYIAADSEYRGVINKLRYKGEKEIKYKEPLENDDSLEGKNYNVIIVGAGIIGCSIARELSKWNLSILLIDKEDDVAMQTSSRNDGMIHPGLAPKIGTLKSKFNVMGNKLYEDIGKELGVKVERCGSNIIFNKSYEKMFWPLIKRKAERIGIKGVKKLKGSELREKEPFINEEAKWGVFIPSTGVTSPYKMTIAFAENAVVNGVDLRLNTLLKGIKRDGDVITSIDTNRGNIRCDLLINAAGVFADNVAAMVDDQFFTIHPRKGEIVLFDKKKGIRLSSVIGRINFSGGKKHSKGGGLVKTLEGNILMGPNAYEQPNKEDYSTRVESIEGLIKTHMPLIQGLSSGDIITYCGGNRAATYKEDFVIEKSRNIKNLIYAAGIQSPGFASAPAIALEIEKMAISSLRETMFVNKKEDWIRERRGYTNMMLLTNEEKSKKIAEDKNYGIIVCRCEGVTRGEIIESLKSPVPAKTVDAVKRRVRAGMGRCQGGFCLPNVMEIIREETGTEFCEVTKKGGSSRIVVRETK